MGDDNGRGIWFPIVAGFLFFLGWIGGAWNSTNRYQGEAIEYGYAEYNKETGDWQWKPKPIEVTGVGVVGEGTIEWNDGTVTEAPR